MKVHRALTLIAGVLLLLMGALFVQKAAKADPPVSGAIFTTDSSCTQVNGNIYDNKGDVYIDGGPKKPGAAGLPDGYYYVQVTDPSGMTVLGTSVGSANPTPVHVTNGDFDQCYQLCAILTCTANCAADACGYGNTPNPGGEYKVWVSNRPDFANNSTKTDNFKVRASQIPNPPPASTLIIKKFYDTNMDGIPNDGSGGDPIWIEGWKIHITGTTSDNVSVDEYVLTTFDDTAFPPGDYDIAEGTPTGSSWFHTYSTANGATTTATTVHIHLAQGDSQTVLFGNVCVGAGGGLTLGYWSNKNGTNSVCTSTLGASNVLAGLNNLCLANGTGALGSPHFASYSKYQTWLLSASATNMAYMLSAQMSAMWLNVNAKTTKGGTTGIFDGGGKLVGGVDGNALIFVGVGVTGTNAFGFMTVNDLLAAANTSVCSSPTTITSGTTRNYQTILKNALDAGNNNANAFVQSGPCPFSF
jgi:hypothetical protein